MPSEKKRHAEKSNKMSNLEKTTIIKKRVRFDLCKYEETKMEEQEVQNSQKNKIYTLNFNKQLDYVKKNLHQMSDVMLLWYKGIANDAIESITQPAKRMKSSEEVLQAYHCDEVQSLKNVTTIFDKVENAEKAFIRNSQNWLDKSRLNRENLKALRKELREALPPQPQPDPTN